MRCAVASSDEARGSSARTPAAHRPTVSRETRRLLAAAALALAALWILARIRFPDRPPAPTPVAPLLTQLIPRQTFADLAIELRELGPKIAPFLVALGNPDPSAAGAERTGLRITADIVAFFSPPVQGAGAGPEGVIARDRATGLTVASGSESMANFEPPVIADVLAGPEYLIAARMSAGELSMQPALVPSFSVRESAVWSGPVWTLPAGTNVTPGSWLFTDTAQLAGLAVEFAGATVIVPAATLWRAVERLRSSPSEPAGWIGVSIHSVAPNLRGALGGNDCVVASVDPQGPGAQELQPGDTVEAIDDAPACTQERWSAVVNRLTAEQMVTLRLRRGDQRREIRLKASPPPTPAPALPRELGFALRRVALGSEIVRVTAGSAADAAGLRPGDLIHLAGEMPAPTPAAVRNAFLASTVAQPLVVGITRGDTYLLLTLRK
jgi:hypothetical protein